MRRFYALVLLVSPLLTASTSPASGSFVDVTAAAGVAGPLSNSYVHAAAWGDVDGDGRPDLFAGTFVTGPTIVPDQLLLNGGGVFVDAGQAPVEVSGRGAGALFADLDGDGDDDLLLSNNRKTNGSGAALEPSHVFRNDGGVFVDVTAGSGIEAQSSNGRQAGVLDFDEDGLLDLFIVADAFAGGGPSVLLRNDGGMHFTDVTAAAGLPADVHGLGLAVGDVTGDGRSEIFVAGGPDLSSPNANYMFVANGDGTFRSVVDHGLDWSGFAVGPEDWVSAGAFGDVDLDGRLDLLVGHHFGSASNLGVGVPVRLYLNRGLNAQGNPIFEDVTATVGLPAIDSKAPHVDIQDFDNDGLADLYVSVTVGGQPIVFYNTGVVNGMPTFAIPSVADPHYYPVGPVADFDLDGRLDIFLGEFRSVFQGTPDDQGVVPSVLLSNQIVGGNWLEVMVAAPGDGIGTVVAVYRAGQAGQAGALLGYRQIQVGYGFSSAGLAVAHFGLGSETTVDLVVTLPRGAGTVTVPGVAANQRLTIGGDGPDPLAPLAWWPLDEPSGTVAIDATGNGFDGTLVGAVTRVPGVLGGAVALAGSGQRIEVPAAALDDAEVVTLAMWLKTTSTAQQSIVGGAGPGDANALDVKLVRGNKIQVASGGGGVTLSWTVPSLSDGLWHHLALVRDAAGDTMTLYIDGTSKGTKTAALAPLNISTVGFGADQLAVNVFSTKRSWVGSFDDIRIYHRALTPAEIAALAIGG